MAALSDRSGPAIDGVAYVQRQKFKNELNELANPSSAAHRWCD